MEQSKSKTVVFNILALLVAIAGGFGFVDFQPTPEITALAAGIVALINLYLRLRKLPPEAEAFR